jgi:transcriptional regulator EpsA
VLVFGHGEYGTPNFRCEVLARNNTWEDRALHSELNRLIEMMVDSWQSSGYQPRLFAALSEENNPDGCTISRALNRLGLGHALAHGAKEFPGDCSGFFVFMRMTEAPGRRHAYFADMLMPYLHTTLHRMLLSEKGKPEGRVRPGLTLSTREAQVISLVRDGNTNQQIAVRLGLSPLTIKNHVQNVLRKLEVANRAQAVAKAVKARLIGDTVGS